MNPDDLAAANDHQLPELPGAGWEDLFGLLQDEVDELVGSGELASELPVSKLDHDLLTLCSGQEGARGFGQCGNSGSRKVANRPQTPAYKDLSPA
jgi:hypothetical protein